MIIIRTAAILAFIGISEAFSYFVLQQLIKLLSWDNFSDWLVFDAIVNGMVVGFSFLFLSGFIGHYIGHSWQSPITGFLRGMAPKSGHCGHYRWVL